MRQRQTHGDHAHDDGEHEEVDEPLDVAHRYTFFTALHFRSDSPRSCDSRTMSAVVSHSYVGTGQSTSSDFGMNGLLSVVQLAQRIRNGSRQIRINVRIRTP